MAGGAGRVRIPTTRVFVSITSLSMVWSITWSIGCRGNRPFVRVATHTNSWIDGRRRQEARSPAGVGGQWIPCLVHSTTSPSVPVRNPIQRRRWRPPPLVALPRPQRQLPRSRCCHGWMSSMGSQSQAPATRWPTVARPFAAPGSRCSRARTPSGGRRPAAARRTRICPGVTSTARPVRPWHDAGPRLGC